jgi:hypothetical protein
MAGGEFAAFRKAAKNCRSPKALRAQPDERG